MEQNRKINTEVRKLKLEIDVPYVYYEALISNPILGDTVIMDKIKKNVLNTLHKSYHNPRVLPDAIRKYLEAKHGIPVMPDKKEPQVEKAAYDEVEESMQEAEESGLDKNSLA